MTIILHKKHKPMFVGRTPMIGMDRTQLDAILAARRMERRLEAMLIGMVIVLLTGLAIVIILFR